MTKISTLTVFQTMRAKLLARNVKCGLADSFAMATVKIYKRLLARGCTDAFERVTSDRRADHYAELSRV